MAKMPLNEIIKRAKKILISMQKGEFKLAELLVAANDEHGVSPAELATALGCSARRVTYLLAMYRVCQKAKISQHEAKKLSWVKLALLSPVVGQLDKGQVLQMVSEMTAVEIKEYTRGTPKYGTVKPRVFLLNHRQHLDLDDTLVRFGAIRSGRGLVHKELALMNLVRAVSKPTLALVA